MLHQMVDSLPESEWDAAARALYVLRLRATRPVDDDPVSEEDTAAIAEARRSLSKGLLIPHSGIQRDNVS